MTYIIGEGTAIDRESLRLDTRRRRHIPNVLRKNQNPDTLKRSHQDMLKQHSDIYLRSLTGVYNCMGMIFAARRTWVGIDDLDAVLAMIFLDDEYQRLTSEDECAPGDIVVYRDTLNEVSHVAVYICKNSFGQKRVLSKWGPYGEYVHELTNVPMTCGLPKEFWTDRKTII